MTGSDHLSNAVNVPEQNLILAICPEEINLLFYNDGKQREAATFPIRRKLEKVNFCFSICNSHHVEFR